MLRLVLAIALLASAASWAESIALIRGTYAGAVKSSEAGSTEAFAATLGDALTQAGLEYTVLGDEDVAAGKLQGYKLAIFAYTPLWAPSEAEAAARFIQGGGKVIGFYTVPAPLLQALGMQPTEYVKDDGQGRFHECRLAPDAPAVQGAPPVLLQDSWNIGGARPDRPDAHVLYAWADKKGQLSGTPALLISDSGVYMTHVLLRADWPAKVRLVFALCANYLPDLWPQAAQRALSEALTFDAFNGLEHLEALVRRAEARGEANDPGPALQRTRAAYRKLQDAVAAGRHVDAVDLEAAVRAAATETYARCQPSREAELRAAWIHTAFGVADWGWEKSIRHLKEKGFNAIFPNMCWGGGAYYDSQVLPVAEEVKTRGDQVAECLKWCRKYGVELHVWKVNWNLGGAHTPDAFRQRLREESRLQRDPEGKEIDWLCPSDDRNFALERDAMLELVRKYHVDGIHFDYIRYPDYSGCFCDRCRTKFEARVGHPVAAWPADVITGPLRIGWLQFRRDNISRLVQAVATATRRLDPHCRVSAAVFGWWDSARDSVGQDWVRWVNEGWLDMACPMDYVPDNDSLGRVVTKQTQWIGGRIPLYVGIGEWELRDSAHLIYQTDLTRHRGADGFVLFHYDHPELTGERMDLLSLGLTRRPAILPHRGPKVAWTLPQGLPGQPAATFLEGAKVAVEAHLAVACASPAYLELRGLDGERDLRLAAVPAGARAAKASFTIGRHPVRLALCCRDADGRLAFEVRSPILWALSRADFEELEARKLPPEFAGPGLAVAVYQESYGGPTILKALQAMAGVEAKPLYALTPDMLKPCRVVVVPQPRRPEDLTPEVVGGLRAYVQAGGQLLVTHDAVGFRRCPAILPEVCAGGADRAEETAWQLAASLPAAPGLALGKPYQHTFWDHILLTPGPAGKVVATDPQGRPLVIQGAFGEGRFCACGLALGLADRADEDAPLPETEAGLLRGLIYLWQR
jgi:uncharacterized lipoprotein YddW (UPF0748 family)